MEKLLHDSFANYVAQTSLDFSDEDQCAELVECVRSLLSTIRSMPYGKRIYSKIYHYTNKSGIFNKPQSTQQQRQRHLQSNDTENLDGETLDQ
ncbi:hypothetical protein MFLAVUS_007717 [Mucor flavus]|uniref:PUM-HD domain-containing protein n=1 Tax=Mucor flavus TaxID=439312 RepID=A0ABP9Z540_9FUNG